MRLTRLACGNHCAIVRFFTCLNYYRLQRLSLFLFYASQRGGNSIMVFGRRLSSGALMAFKTRCFFTFKARLSGFKPCFRFSGSFFFLANGVNLGFFLAEILHQRNIAWAYPGAGTAFNAVGDIVGRCFVVLLPFTEPIKLLWQEIRRTGIGACATANAAFLFRRFTHFTGRGGQKTVGNLHHRDIQPWQRKPHQRSAHNHHLVGGRAEARVVEQMTNRRAQTRPDVARTADGFTGKRHDTFGDRLTVNYCTFNCIGGSDVLHQYADI